MKISHPSTTSPSEPPQRTTQLLLATLLAIALFSPSISLLGDGISIFDERRIYMIIALCLGGILYCARPPHHAHPAFTATIIILVIYGFLNSAFIARFPSYAALEVCVFALIAFSCSQLGTFHINELRFRQIILPALASSVALYGIAALVRLFAGFFIEGNRPDWPEPLHNFVNRRMLNDLQTWTLPMLPAVLFAKIPLCRANFHRTLSFVYFSLWWAILLFTLGRATLYVQIACIILVPALFGRFGFRWSGIQISAACFGLTLLILVLGMNPFTSNAPTSRLVSLESSGRYELWGTSWEFIQQNPFYGIGPMHFASVKGVSNAHPHNFLLQSAVEWGIPATIILFGCIGWLALKWLQFARHEVKLPNTPTWKKHLIISLTASIAAAAGNSMAAGTVVMPISIIMLVLIVGLAYNIYANRGLSREPTISHTRDHLTKVSIAVTAAATIWLAGFSSYSLYHYIKWRNSNPAPVGNLTYWAPRYWNQGLLIDDK